jgi:hypothetical protein
MNQLVKINFTNAYIQDYVDINTTKNKETLHRLDQFQMMLPSFSNRVVAGRMRASGDYCARAPPEANRGWRGKRSGGVQWNGMEAVMAYAYGGRWSWIRGGVFG